MRFSTILAFMLPLAALAVPTPPPSARDLQAQLQQLNEARERFTNALIETSGAVNKTIDLATELKQSAVLDQVNKANDNLELAFLAALKVDADAKAGIQPSDDDQFVVTKNSLEAQKNIKGLKKLINNKDKSDKASKDQLKQLWKVINAAVNGVNKMVNAGVDILSIQGKSVRELFEDRGEPVPPGF